MDGDHLGRMRSHRAPTRLHSILQQLQLVPRQGQVLSVSCLCFHIYSWVGTAKGEPLTPPWADRAEGHRQPQRWLMGTPPLPEHSPSPGSAHPVSSHSHLPVPRQTSTTSAAPTTFTSSAREYRWHRGSLQPAVKLTLAPSISSPLLHQKRAEDTGSAVPQGRGTNGDSPLTLATSQGPSSSSSSPKQCQE